MSATAKGCKKLCHTLAVLNQKRATGQLLLEQGEQQWQLYFFRGCLLYATGGSHRSRRWYRAIAQHCRDFRIDISQVADGEPWEYQLLRQGLAQSEMGLEQAQAILSSSTGEVFFALGGESALLRKWHPYKQPPFAINRSLQLSGEEVQGVLGASDELWQQWYKMGLSHLSPDQAPILKESPELKSRVSSDSLLALSSHFNGQNTLWDIAVNKKQCLTVATRTLYHFVKQGFIDFRTVPDVPSPIEQWRLAAAICSGGQPGGKVLLPPPLIACIDDSRAVCEFLEEILVPAGYQVLKILDPMQGVATLAQYKPDLIFLDVVMPKTDGFALCTFLRKTPTFRHTPIVFLTGQDGFIDRTRAKLTGCSDFISKPPTPEKVLQVVDKHLKRGGDRLLGTNANDGSLNPVSLILARS